jgi:hypothetical protein
VLRRSIVRTPLTALFVITALYKGPAARQQAPALDETSRNWMQQILETWTTVAQANLRISPEPVPWMIFYDDQRAWHLNADVTRLPAGFRRSPTNVVAGGREYPVHVVTHEQEVWLPAGEPLPVGEGKPPRVFAMPYANGQQSFTAIALPVLLRRMPGMDDEKSFATFFIGVAGHELVHTRQLTDVLRRVTQLRERYPVPSGITDSFIQQTFASDAAYAGLYAKERDLLFQAAAAIDDKRESSLRLISEALSLVEKRRATFFTGDRTAYAELDDIFLGMEGIAMWVQFQVARAHAPKEEPWQTTALNMLKGNTEWVQEEGFVLFVLIDRLVPNWQARFFGPDFPSAFAVLREAVRR